MRLTHVFFTSLAIEWTNPSASGGTGGARRHCGHLGEARSFSLCSHKGKVAFWRSDLFQ